MSPAEPPTAAPGWRLWPRRVLAWPVRAYRLLLSPSLGSACRFVPSCSAYALEALDQHGARRGTGLTLWRLARCHPWCDGGFDPVPAAGNGGCPEGSNGLFTRLLPAAQPSILEGAQAAPTPAGPAGPSSSASSPVTTGK